MNIERNAGRTTGWIIIGVFIALTAFACKKTGSTEAIVTVIDGTTKAAVSGATVTLWQDTAVNNTNGVQSNLRRTTTTDASGRATFEFELEAFLNVEVIKGQDTGRSYIRLKEHESEEVTVSL